MPAIQVIRVKSRNEVISYLLTIITKNLIESIGTRYVICQNIKIEGSDFGSINSKAGPLFCFLNTAES